MKKLVIAIGLLVATMSTASAQRQANSDVPYRFFLDDRAKVIKVNAPGGAYIQCGGPYGPVRCTADGW